METRRQGGFLGVVKPISGIKQMATWQGFDESHCSSGEEEETYKSIYHSSLCSTVAIAMGVSAPSSVARLVWCHQKVVGGKGRPLLWAAQSQYCLEELRVTSREHLVSVARDGHLQKGPSESGVSCTFAAAHRTFRGPKEVAPGNSRSLATGPHAMRYFCLRHSPCVRTALRASRRG